MKTLVTYYSRTGTTSTLGEAIAAALHADSDEILDLKQRRGALHYMSSARAAKGLKTTEIHTDKSPENYDLVIIGTPIWWGSLTPAIRTYLSSHNLAGKKLAFFITSQSEDRDAVFTQMEELAPSSEVLCKFGMLQRDVQGSALADRVSEFVSVLGQCEVETLTN